MRPPRVHPHHFTTLFFLSLLISSTGWSIGSTNSDGRAVPLPPSWVQLAKSAGADDNQLKKIEAIVVSHQKSLIDMRATIEKKRVDLKLLLSRDEVDEKEAMALQDEIGKVETEMDKLRLKLFFDLRKTLTKEQYRRLANLSSKLENGDTAGRSSTPSAEGAAR